MVATSRDILYQCEPWKVSVEQSSWVVDGMHGCLGHQVLHAIARAEAFNHPTLIG